MRGVDWYFLVVILAFGWQAARLSGKVAKLEREVRFLTGHETNKDVLGVMTETLFEK